MGVYNGGLTREQFLFFETRTTAKLMVEGLDDSEIINRIFEDNLFQFPTERMVKNLAGVCLKRLHALDDMNLVNQVAHGPSEDAKQICLYAMMKYNRLVWDFMITVIGEKYRQQDLHFSKSDINVFFMRLQEQDDGVAAWSEATINKIRQVLTRVLIENGYLGSTKADKLNPVLICSTLENAIRNEGNDIALQAFNCFI
ncbi:MAG: DUF1819 family protein [Parasporobacterium sp.]|nr:DUF1819 family protein [Parasporobacterium sp.]